jgi:hypothetical protein
VKHFLRKLLYPVFLLCIISVPELLAAALGRGWIKVPALRTLANEFYEQSNRSILQYETECAVYSPTLTYTLRSPGCIFRNIEFSNRIDVNSLGTRDSEEALKKPELIVTGDSFAMGWGVEQAQTFGAVSGKTLGLRTLNTAVPSYGTARELLMLKNVDRSALRTLIIQFCDNDQDENLSFIKHGGVLPIMPEAAYQSLVRISAENRQYFPGKLSRDAIRILIERRRRPEFRASPAIARDKASAFLEVLARSPVALENVNILVLELDKPYRFDPYFAAAVNELKTRLLPRQIAERLTAIDTTSVVRADDFYWLDGHLTAEGHRKIAEAIVARLKETSSANGAAETK